MPSPDSETTDDLHSDPAGLGDVARLAGVSEKTVVRALNGSPLLGDAAHNAVRDAIAQLGFVADRQLYAPVARRTNPVFLVVHDDPFDPFLSEVQAAMVSALGGHPHALCVVRHDASAANAMRNLGDFLELHRPSGAVLMPSLAQPHAVAGLLWEYGARSVRLGAGSNAGRFGCMTSLDRVGAANAVRWLAEQGHRRIGFIASEDDPCATPRELGYLDAMADLELDRGPALIAGGTGGFEAGLKAGGELLEISPAPTAILASSDAVAAGLIRAASAKGVAVPGALSVIGFGDTPLARELTPALTTVRVSMREMAHRATQMLLDPDNPVSESHCAPAILVERETVAACQV